MTNSSKKTRTVPDSLNWIELSQKALNKNINSLAKLAGDKRTLAVSVKANGYGHGLAEMVEMLLEIKRVQQITVHSVAEADFARIAGWDRKIMLLGPASNAELDAIFELDLEPMIFEKSSLDKLGRLASKYDRKLRTHLKLETGTNRQGVSKKELPAFTKIYQKYQNLGRPYGAAMHFANIEDTTNHDYAENQLAQFKQLLAEMTKLKIKPTVRHTASSAAMILFEKTRYDIVRPGLSCYGYWPSKETYLSYIQGGGHDNLFNPIMSWKTRVTQLKAVPRNSFVGYGCTYRTTSDSRLAVIPIGYYDGFSRDLSNLGYVLIKGQRAPVRGRVCMNLAMVDVTDIKGVKVGDQVTIIGSDGPETLTADNLADWSGSINYEVLSRLASSISRQIVR